MADEPGLAQFGENADLVPERRIESAQSAGNSQRSAVSGLDALRQLVSRHAHNSHGPSAIEGLTITATDAPTSPRPGVAEPSLGLVIQGRKRTASGDRVFDYAAGEFLIAQLDLPVTGQVTEASAECPFLGIGIRIEPPEIAAMLLEAAPPGDTPLRAPGMEVARAGAPLLDALSHLAGLLDNPRDVPVLAPLYRREVLWRLLTGPQGAVVREIGRTGTSPTSPVPFDGSAIITTTRSGSGSSPRSPG
jgi:hypothetical protein